MTEVKLDWKLNLPKNYFEGRSHGRLFGVGQSKFRLLGVPAIMQWIAYGIEMKPDEFDTAERRVAFMTAIRKSVESYGNYDIRRMYAAQVIKNKKVIVESRVNFGNVAADFAYAIQLVLGDGRLPSPEARPSAELGMSQLEDQLERYMKENPYGIDVMKSLQQYASPAYAWRTNLAGDGEVFKARGVAYSLGLTFLVTVLARFGETPISAFSDVDDYYNSVEVALGTLMSWSEDTTDSVMGQKSQIVDVAIPIMLAEARALIGHAINCGVMPTIAEYFQVDASIVSISESDWLNVFLDAIEKYKSARLFPTADVFRWATTNLMGVYADNIDLIFDAIITAGFPAKREREGKKRKSDDDGDLPRQLQRVENEVGKVKEEVVVVKEEVKQVAGDVDVLLDAVDVIGKQISGNNSEWGEVSVDSDALERGDNVTAGDDLGDFFGVGPSPSGQADSTGRTSPFEELDELIGSRQTTPIPTVDGESQATKLQGVIRQLMREGRSENSHDWEIIARGIGMDPNEMLGEVAQLASGLTSEEAAVLNKLRDKWASWKLTLEATRDKIRASTTTFGLKDALDKVLKLKVHTNFEKWAKDAADTMVRAGIPIDIFVEFVQKLQSLSKIAAALSCQVDVLEGVMMSKDERLRDVVYQKMLQRLGFDPETIRPIDIERIHEQALRAAVMDQIRRTGFLLMNDVRESAQGRISEVLQVQNTIEAITDELKKRQWSDVFALYLNAAGSLEELAVMLGITLDDAKLLAKLDEVELDEVEREKKVRDLLSPIGFKVDDKLVNDVLTTLELAYEQEKD